MRCFRFSALVASSLLAIGPIVAQDDPCLNWSAFPQQQANAAEEAHVIYRDAIKLQDFERAFPMWKKAYEMAPAADGKRPFHYIDGRDIYLHRFANASDDAAKKEATQWILKLYDQERQCYQNEAPLYARQVYDMFYTLQTPYTETYPIAKKAMDLGGDKTDFRVLTPIGYLVTYMFTNDLIDQAEARATVEQARRIAEANAASPQAADYKTAIDGMNAAVVSIERNIFDCAYFKARLEPQYRADPNNPETWKTVYTQLLQSGCEKVDPLLAEISAKDRAYQDSVYVTNNPLAAGQRLYEEGDVDGALAKWEEAAASADAEARGAIYLKMASVMRSDKHSMTEARRYARKAAEARPGWGRPYIFIGDMYASSSRSCGNDPFGQRVVILAAIDEYSRAKNDPETAAEAQSRINKYGSSIPTKAMAFERGLTEGQSMSTGCWIGETVTLRTSG